MCDDWVEAAGAMLRPQFINEGINICRNEIDFVAIPGAIIDN